MTLPGVLFVLIFSYIPMIGVIVAFQDYSVSKGFFGSPWVGFKHYAAMFSDPTFWRAAKNTVFLSAYGIILGFPAPLILALILNEIPFLRYKKLVQTASYLPYFVSFVLVAQLWIEFLEPKGVVNQVLLSIGLIEQPVEFWMEPRLFRIMATAVNIWKGAGWGAILYLAALAGLNEEMYEAAVIDGARRLRRLWSITLPSMLNIITVLFILGIAGLVRGSIDTSVLLGNIFNREVSYVVEYYTVEMGIQLGRYSFATAIGLFQSALAMTLVLGTNWLSGRLGGRRIF